MAHTYSFAYLTAHGLDPVAATHLAAKLGYDHISYRLLPAGPGDTPPPLLTDDGLFREVQTALKATGLTVSDIEIIRLNDSTDIDSYKPFLARGRELGASHVLVTGDDTDRARLIDTYGRLCTLIAGYDLTADLEFMPWTGVKNIADAREVVEAVAHPAAAILFDTLHFDRCGSTLDEISAIPRNLMNYVQICDGPVPYDPDDAAMLAVGRTARLVPGDGGIDLAAIVARLPDDVPISVEVPNPAQVAEVGVETLARRSLEAARALFGETG